jgi:hypothetical protein
MTLRMDSMPALSGTRANWDAELSKVRYYANFEGSDDWIEVPGEDFDRLTRLYATEAIDMVCFSITQAIENIKGVLGEFSAFKEGLEEKFGTKARPEGDN